ILSLIAYLLAHWSTQWSPPPVLDWKAASDLTLSVLFPSGLWLKLLRYIRINADIAARYGFKIVLIPIPT
ncbi:MAG: transposase, partial [Pseudanabaena sp.]